MRLRATQPVKSIVRRNPVPFASGRPRESATVRAMPAAAANATWPLGNAWTLSIEPPATTVGSGRRRCVTALVSSTRSSVDARQASTYPPTRGPFHSPTSTARPIVATADQESLIRIPIKELVEQLDPEVFWQIHRGTVVNVTQVAGVSRDFRGHMVVRLKQRPETLAVSDTYAHRFRQM